MTAIRMTHVPSLTATATIAFAREWKGLRIGIWIVMSALLVLATGGTVESVVAPVLVRHYPSNVRRVTPEKLCWTFDFSKVRYSMPSRVYAELFLDDAVFPVFVGLEHDDGTSVGGLLGWDPGAAITTQCVHVPKNGALAKRLGVRIHIAYTTRPSILGLGRVTMPWFVPGPDTWIDWFRDDYTGPRGS